MLSREVRCRVLSLLLSAVKIERDQQIVSDIIKGSSMLEFLHVLFHVE